MGDRASGQAQNRRLPVERLYRFGNYLRLDFVFACARCTHMVRLFFESLEENASIFVFARAKVFVFI